MGKLKKEYDELKKQRETIVAEIKQLEESETVKRYFELIKQNNDLYK